MHIHPHGLTWRVRVPTVFPSPPRGENGERSWSPKGSTFPPQPCLQIGAEVSPNLRVLMFASAAGGDALKQDDTGHWGRGGVG